jgi:2-C-methyl-D-erythritol 2,4-cyclodiphosphate synthase
MMLRIGVGYDMHAFVEGRPLVLGGVIIPGDMGLAGHSDADVLVHALMDALLGAMREGDIGKLFPDDDPAFKDVSSLSLLGQVAVRMRERGWRLLDADTVLIMQQPKIAPYREEMRAAMAAVLEVPIDAVGVKATTTEGLGAIGRLEGAGAQAVVLLERDGE